MLNGVRFPNIGGCNLAAAGTTIENVERDAETDREYPARFDGLNCKANENQTL